MTDVFVGFVFDDEKEKSRREIDKLKQEIESLQKKRIEVKSQIDYLNQKREKQKNRK